MLKKILIGASLASASLVAQAADMNTVNCDFFSGAYVGAAGIYQSNNDKFTQNREKGQPVSSELYAGRDGWGGGLFAGYGRIVGNNVYLGAELYGKALEGKQKISTKSEDDYLAMKTPYSYGVMAKVGYLVNQNALVYVGLGAENTRFKLVKTTAGAAEDALDANKWGYVPSVGMNLAIDCNWQVGAQLSYANYRSIEYTDATSSNTGTIDPRRATFGLNVTYHFV
jgi:opacity protein-like surface antigen